MKRVYPVILSCLLIAFSFYYTNKVAGIVRGKDPIMQSIKEEKANYEKKAINANVSGDNIIPGKMVKRLILKQAFRK